MTPPFTVPHEVLDVSGVIAACAASAGLPTWRTVRRGASGTLLIAFALASLTITGGAEAVGDGLTVTSFAITCGIALLGLFILVSQIARALGAGGWRRATQLWVTLAALLALAITARPLASLADTGGGLIALATAVLLFFLGALIRFIGSWIPIRRGLSHIDRLLCSGAVPFPGGGISERAASAAVWIHVLGAMALLAAPHLQLFMVVLMVAMASGVVVECRLGQRRIPLSAVAAIPALGVCWYLLAHVAGEASLRLTALRDAPYSTAFQLTTSLVLGLAAWSLLGLWPLLGPPPGPLAPLLGGLLLVRVITPALPEGLLHWQPLLYPLAAIAACHAAVFSRDDEALAALAALGLLSGVPAAGGAGLGLAAASIVARMVRRLSGEGRVLNRRGRRLVATLAIAASGLLLPVLSGALAAQVFYSVVTVAALALALGTSDEGARCEA
jgi:hypothetical protein